MTKRNLSQRVKELESLLTIGNFEERIKELERLRKVDKGNLEQEIERRKALEKYLGVDITRNYKYKVKKHEHENIQRKKGGSCKEI